MTQDAEYWIRNLKLTRHIEGGYFRETYKSQEKIKKQCLPTRYIDERHYYTTIYYLIKSGEVSKIHKILSDEVWYFHAGTSATIYIFGSNQSLIRKQIGLNILEHEYPQVLVTRNTFFACTVNKPNSYILVSCQVSPGFNYDDYTIPEKNWMKENYPKYSDIIEKLL